MPQQKKMDTSSCKYYLTAFAFSVLFFSAGAQSQVIDTVAKKNTTFSGSLGFSSNGFSIVPTFSLNSPASMILLSLRKNKFSFDPDIRLTPDAKKGSMIFWFRYHAIDKKKYHLRIGAHPAMNFQTREITVNNNTSTISQMRRFFAWEVSNDYKINSHWNTGIYYLQGNGLQKDGARTTHFISFNNNFSNIGLSKTLRLAISPSLYYLYLDGSHGEYVSGTVTLSHTKLPFSLQHAFNKTISSNIPGNKDYMWNVSMHYHFKKTYRRV
jgi:hypothetical protein